MARISTIQRTLQHLRKYGGDVAKVERPYNSYTKRRNDLFGFCDILWVCKQGVHHYIQCCTYKDLDEHVKKIRRKASAIRLNKYGNVTIEVYAWRRTVVKGRTRWQHKVIYPF